MVVQVPDTHSFFQPSAVTLLLRMFLWLLMTPFTPLKVPDCTRPLLAV